MQILPYSIVKSLIVFSTLSLFGCASEPSGIAVYDQKRIDNTAEELERGFNSPEKLSRLIEWQKKLFPDSAKLPNLDNLHQYWKPSKLIKAGDADYPRHLRDLGYQGVVHVAMLINELGEVVDTRVYETTNPNLNDAALKTAQLWKFKPALLNGAPQYSALVAPIRFELPLTKTPNIEVNTAPYCQIFNYRVADVPGSVASSSRFENRLIRSTKELSNKIQNVSLSIGTRFGYDFTIGNIPDDATLELDFKAPNVDQKSLSKTLPLKTNKAGSLGYIYFNVDNEIEAIPGQWDLSVIYSGRKLCSKSFMLVKK
jgi:TonB family protein